MAIHRTIHNDARSPARYVVGIDLGTTNSAACYVDTAERPWRVRTLPAPQVTAPGQIEARETLPSFHYQPAAGELAAGALRCPWHHGEPGFTVGVFAREHGTLVPGRMIASAKSWLCHSGVDRTAAILPWHAVPDVERLSPVEAASRYLAHLRDAWDHRFAGFRLADQDVVLTLPASFDEVARELTVKAAALAGLARVVLIEEPQAAFYAWINAHRDDWEEHVRPGQKILVCDVGGGTSDFTLIRVRRGEGGKVQFHRVAVGEHLILGGDNFDLTLAQHVERRLLGEESGFRVQGSAVGDDAACGFAERLEPRQWSALVGACRAVKEAMLGPDSPERMTVNLPGSGARLIGGGLRAEVSRDEVHEVLVEGFFPRVGLDDKPQRRRSGFQEFGLPYAPDPAVTRYLAAFLTAHRHAGEDDGEPPADHDPARPDVVLFNGGVFNSPVLRERLLDALRSWFSAGPASGGESSSAWSPQVLDNERLDLAVALGAAYYGMVRRGEGVRIAAGLARTYYMGVETAQAARGLANLKSEIGNPKSEISAGEAASGVVGETASGSSMAVCIVPAGVEPGQEVELGERTFELRVSEPVEFPLYVSSTRLTDRPGAVVPFDREEMTPLPPIRTVLRTRRKGAAETASVALHARLSEIGTLDLWCAEAQGRRSWRLQFDVRAATQTDVAAHESQAEAEGYVDEAVWQPCRALVEAAFGPEGRQPPEGLVKHLAAAAGMSRNAWPTSLCRRIWEVLMEFEPGRRRSAVHEARWINLLGFALRPGYGLAVDDWRVAETWRALQGRFAHATPAVRTEGWILWRRIGGGLAPGQQQAVAEPLLGPVRALHRQTTTGKGRGEFGFSTSETAEIWRLLGSLELLDVALKIEIGGILLDLLPKRKMEPVRPAIVWALGRMGARQPMYGPLNAVVPGDVAAEWLKRLLDAADPAVGRLAVMQLARRTGDRYRDLPERGRDKAAAWLQRAEAPPHYVQLVREGGSLDEEEAGLVFGESLPKGLRLRETAP